MEDLKKFESEAQTMLAKHNLTANAQDNAYVMAPMVDKPFTIVDIAKVDVSEPRDGFTPVSFRTSVGFNVPVKVIAAVEGLDMTIGSSVLDIATAACALKANGTEFQLTTYKKAKGKWGEDDYKPATYECELL